MRALLLLSLLAGAAAAAATAESEAPEPLYEMFYRVSAGARSARLDADLEAGGRLLMRARRTESGYLHLALERPLESPWKLYWVDPAGPFGDEVKLASVATLPAGTWEALAEARARADRFAAERYAAWTPAGRRKPSFDGAFTFVVIGPAAGRFTASFDAAGTLTAVRNRLTDRWLSGPFDQWVGTWGPGAAGPATEGYWFWNRGEGRPFSYEPHTYHAFEAALRFLGIPMDPLQTTPDGEDLVPRHAWPDLGAMAVEVVETLAPRARGLFSASAGAVPVDFAEERMSGGATLRRASAHTPDGALTAEREMSTPLPGEPGAAADRFTLGWRRGSASIEIEVGYAAAGTAAPPG